jgi:hypothetical protein
MYIPESIEGGQFPSLKSGYHFYNLSKSESESGIQSPIYGVQGTIDGDIDGAIEAPSRSEEDATGCDATDLPAPSFDWADLFSGWPGINLRGSRPNERSESGRRELSLMRP